MKKKTYFSPETEVITIDVEELMGYTVSGEELKSDPNPDENQEDDDNRSRRLRNVWDEEMEEEEEEYW